MKDTSNFNFECVTVEEFKVLHSGSVICYRDELFFHFKEFTLKMLFLNDDTNNDARVELDSEATLTIIKCFNFFVFRTPVVTTEPIEIARSKHEILYVAFSFQLVGNSKLINYNFLSSFSPKIITN